MTYITFIKGQHPWNYGLTKETDYRVLNNSNSLKGIKKTQIWKDNISTSTKGKHNSPETEFKKGHKPKSKKEIIYFLNLCECGCNEIVYGNRRFVKGHQARVIKPTLNILTCIKISNTMKGRTLSPEHCQNISKANIGENSHSYGKKGELAYAWKGGLSLEDYSNEWNDVLKEFIRERDNHICQLCNRKQEELYRKLDIHHIDYNKYNCSIYNLISLCHRCHTLTNWNREYYQTLFNKKLEIFYIYCRETIYTITFNNSCKTIYDKSNR